MVQAAVLHRLLLLLILIGIVASVYATFEVLDPGLQGTCSVNSYVSCQAVDQSGHDTVGPIPDWSIGLGGFIVLLALDIPLFRTYDPRFLYAIFFLSLAGIGFALYFAYMEIVVINAICPVCTTAHLANVGVFLTTWKLISLRKSTEEEEGGTTSPPARSSKKTPAGKARAKKSAE